LSRSFAGLFGRSSRGGGSLVAATEVVWLVTGLATLLLPMLIPEKKVA
jgi:hypothetical protein